MTRPPDTSASPGSEEMLRRFVAAERWIHRGTAALLGTAMITAAFLYSPSLGMLVGRRDLLTTVHEWSGLLSPAAVLAGLASRAFRADLTRLNRFTRHDRGWLRATLRRRPHESGKFNPGQKMYAATATGAVLVMIGTGLILWFPKLAPLFIRTGATFVHDWLALLLGALVVGHICVAYNDPDARRGLRTGLVPRSWAKRHHARWEREDRPDDL
jgi:formate dehydrogenase subunit gamma